MYAGNTLLVAIICYTALATEYLWRYVVDAPLRSDDKRQTRTQTRPRMKTLISSMGAITVLIFIRYVVHHYFILVRI
jgi:hypothetical protein